MNGLKTDDTRSKNKETIMDCLEIACNLSQKP